MRRAFIDSSVLYSAAYSSRGYSRDLIQRGAREEVGLVFSNLVLEETRRNLAEAVPHVVVLFDLLIHSLPFETVNPTQHEVQDAAHWVALKDAPIVAAARKARVNMLVTLDKKHLLDKPGLSTYVGAEIITPRTAVERLR